ncbi:hypothetical protein [Streptomyces sp. NBC_01428]|uniref:hypothetical protein n=1 Tax=Streptomyces sp. NBC_01428 TaxID=2903861 RepID=UPI002E332EB7|nr:hypothetical protein [Streptomyces sp. NBC_01428]
MSRFNLAQLAQLALIVAVIEAADGFRRDPAVAKAAKQFMEDGAQAFRSGGALAREVQSYWRRHNPLADGTGTDE